MTADVIALVHGEPTNEVLVRAMLAAAPDLLVGTIADGAALQLFDSDRTLVTTIEQPALIRVPGEAERLLGVADPPEPPYWWIELHAPTHRADVHPIAHALAEALVQELGGRLWSSSVEAERATRTGRPIPGAAP